MNDDQIKAFISEAEGFLLEADKVLARLYPSSLEKIVDMVINGEYENKSIQTQQYTKSQLSGAIVELRHYTIKFNKYKDWFRLTNEREIFLDRHLKSILDIMGGYLAKLEKARAILRVYIRKPNPNFLPWYLKRD